jgi:hypothetical protein
VSPSISASRRTSWPVIPISTLPSPTNRGMSAAGRKTLNWREMKRWSVWQAGSNVQCDIQISYECDIETVRASILDIRPYSIQSNFHHWSSSLQTHLAITESIFHIASLHPIINQQLWANTTPKPTFLRDSKQKPTFNRFRNQVHRERVQTCAIESPEKERLI